MEVPAPDHECSLLPFLKQLAARIEKVEHENAQMRKQVYGQRSERSKLPRPIAAEPATPEEIQGTGRARSKARLEAPVMTSEHRVPDAERRCTFCGGTELSPLGPGKRTSVWEYIPLKLVRHEHVQEVLRCACGGSVLTAPGAPEVVEKGQYGASFIAHLRVAKCVDHLPLYRLKSTSSVTGTRSRARR